MRVAAAEALRRHVAVSPVHRGIGREHHTPLWRGYHGCKEARWSKGWRQEAWRCQETWWRQEARWSKEAPLVNALDEKGSRRFAGFFFCHPERSERGPASAGAAFRQSVRVASRRQLQNASDERVVRQSTFCRCPRELTLALQIAVRIHFDHEDLLVIRHS
jgi:hypothetical protein